MLKWLYGKKKPTQICTYSLLNISIFLCEYATRFLSLLSRDDFQVTDMSSPFIKYNNILIRKRAMYFSRNLFFTIFVLHEKHMAHVTRTGHTITILMHPNTHTIYYHIAIPTQHVHFFVIAFLIYQRAKAVIAFLFILRAKHKK